MVLYAIFMAGVVSESAGMSVLGGILYFGYALAVMIPSLAVTVRRLHDIGKSGWYYFIGLIPFIGGIILLVWFCQDSEAGSNQWGANPKE